MTKKSYIYFGLMRLGLPDYNEAAWNFEGQYLYPMYDSYEEYRAAFEENEDEETLHTKRKRRY